MSRRAHTVNVTICVVMMFLLCVSSALIVHEAAHHHDCAGEDCLACRFLAQAGQLRQISAVVLALIWLGLGLSLARS